MEKEIKVLNIAQPNAYAVMHKGKNVENRSGVSYFRGTIAIYASSTCNKGRFKDSDISIEDCEFGKIIGFVDIVDCIVEEEVTDSTKEWFFGPYGYIFNNVRVLSEPVEVRPPKGAVTWWTLEGQLAEKCLSQINFKSFVPVKRIAADPKKPKQKKSKRRGELIPSIYFSVFVGFEPISFKDAFEEFVEYLELEDLAYYVGEVQNEDTLYIKSDDKIKELTKLESIPGKDIWKIVEDNLSFCDENKLNPSEFLISIIGSSKVTLKQALKKTMNYVDKFDLYGRTGEDEESFQYIVGDEKLKKLVNKEQISFSSLSAAIRENLKKAA